MSDNWRDKRTEAAAEQAKALERRRAGETAQARALIADFVEQARARGIAPVLLYARSYDGRCRYRTATHGWYLRRNQSVAIGADGEFYVLSVPRHLRSRIAGAPLPPSDPPLILGKGARDGESIDLVNALRIALGDAPLAT